MSKLKISSKEIRSLGYPEGPVISVAMNIVAKHCKHAVKQDVLDTLQKMLADPLAYRNDPVFAPVAEKLMPDDVDSMQEVSLNEVPVAIKVYGKNEIEESAIKQMETAARLPIAVAAALMPDAHTGYGLPIGGVLATDNVVIPYGVGVDIGCRMCLSVYDIDPRELITRQSFFKRELGEATLFGSGASFDKPSDHAVMDRKEFYEIPLLHALQTRAWKQLGSSGSGNHFVEFGVVTIEEDDMAGVPAGKYVGLLSHSGSRGLGATVANHFTAIAKELTKLPAEAANLAWLSLNEEAGAAYWLAMNLAGDYAAACHDIIHQKIRRQLGRQPMAVIANHHNFAWKEMHDGRELIVHRKGATPAGKDVLGIIPGSMTANGYIVKGKGDLTSLSSAAHGAGRKMSRGAAMKSVTQKALQEVLSKHGVSLSGGGLDESPFAYKDLDTVMNHQRQLVDVVGVFTPKIVRMSSDASGKNDKQKRFRNEEMVG